MQNKSSFVKTNTIKRIFYFLTYGVCFISLGLIHASFGPLLPTMAEFSNTTLAQISFIFTANSFGYMAGSSGGGRLYDHHNGHRIMLISFGIMILSSIFIPLLPSFYMLLLGFFIFGLGMGALDVGANVNLLWMYESDVGPFMNGLHFCFGLGAFLSPLLVYNILKLTDGVLSWPFWVIALTFIPGILLGLRLLKSPVNPEEDHPANTSKKSNFMLIGFMMLLFFLYVGLEGGFGGWIYTYATEVVASSESAASYMNSIFWGSLTLGRLISVPLAKKISPSKILIGNYSFAVFSLVLILIWPTNILIAWIVSTALGLALSSVFPTLMALSETRMKVTGKVTGLFFLGTSLGGITLPMFLGQILENVGGYYIMVTLFGTACLGLLVLFLVLIASEKAGEKQRPQPFS